MPKGTPAKLGIVNRSQTFLLQSGFQELTHKLFPRPPGRGPVEARSKCRLLRRRPSAFHGLRAVAPLKQVSTVRQDEWQNGVFPRPPGRGPVEAAMMSAANALMEGLLSTASGPWPR